MFCSIFLPTFWMMFRSTTWTAPSCFDPGSTTMTLHSSWQRWLCPWDIATSSPPCWSPGGTGKQHPMLLFFGRNGIYESMKFHSSNFHSISVSHPEAGNQPGFAKGWKASGIPREDIFVCGSVVSNRARGVLALRPSCVSRVWMITDSSNEECNLLPICINLLAKGWTNSNMPPGHYTIIHHSTFVPTYIFVLDCYRCIMMYSQCLMMYSQCLWI